MFRVPIRYQTENLKGQQMVGIKIVLLEYGLYVLVGQRLAYHCAFNPCFWQACGSGSARSAWILINGKITKEKCKEIGTGNISNCIKFGT